MKRLKGECGTCSAVIRCDNKGFASYHIAFERNDECKGSRLRVKPGTIKEEAAVKLPTSTQVRKWMLDILERPVARAKPLRPALVQLPKPEPVVVLEAPPVMVLEPLPEVHVEPPKEEQEEEEILDMTNLQTHPAFIGAPGRPFDIEARKKAVIDTATKLHARAGNWPNRTAIAEALVTRVSMLTAPVAELESEGDIYLHPATGVLVVNSVEREIKRGARAEAKEREKEKKEMKQEQAREAPAPKFENLDVDETEFEGDTTYKSLVDERNELEISTKELRDQLAPQEAKLARIRRALKAYVSPK